MSIIIPGSVAPGAENVLVVRNVKTQEACVYFGPEPVVEVPKEVVDNPAEYGGDYYDDVIEEEDIVALQTIKPGVFVAIRDSDTEDDSDRGAVWPVFEVIANQYLDRDA